MIQRLTESFISSIELVESECRLAKHHSTTFLIDGLALAGLTVVSVIAVVAFVAGVCVLLTEVLGIGLALTITGGVTASITISTAWLIVRRMRDSDTNT